MNTSSSDVRNVSARPPSGTDEKREIPDTKSASDAPEHPGGHEDTADAADRAAFGEFLRQTRERRQKTLQQIADDTQISPHHLTALEEGNVKSLPGGMYRRAMLRAYADSIGLEREAALEQFERTFEPPPRGVERAPQVPNPRPQVDDLAAGRVSAAAATPAPPDRPGRVARSRVRDLGVLLAVIVVSAVAVVGLLTGDERATSGFAPLESSTAEEAATTGGEAAGASADAGTTTGPASTTEGPPASPQPAASQPPVAAGPPRRPARAASSIGSAGPASGGATPAAAVPTAPDIPRAVDTASPAPRATSGELVIATTPSGARVTVNGTGRGESPVTIRLLPFGSKRIRVALDGYISQERVIVLSPDRPTAKVTLTLSPRE